MMPTPDVIGALIGASLALTLAFGALRSRGEPPRTMIAMGAAWIVIIVALVVLLHQAGFS